MCRRRRKHYSTAAVMAIPSPKQCTEGLRLDSCETMRKTSITLMARARQRPLHSCISVVLDEVAESGKISRLRRLTRLTRFRP